MDTKRHGDYFDPYGLEPQHIEFTNFMNEHCSEWAPNDRTLSHESQRDGITICTTFTPFKPENARLLVRKNDIIIDIRVMYDHSKGTTLILSKNIYLLVTGV